MPHLPHVHWYEGLFLSPHYLQVMQRQLHEEIYEDRVIGWPYGYGLISCEIMQDKLAGKTLEFASLRARMHNGVEIVYPGNAHLPAVDLTRALQRSDGEITIFLGVPVWQAKAANVVEPAAANDADARARYRLTAADFPDENTGEMPENIQLRKINACLLTSEDNLSNLDTVPIARIVRAAANDERGLPGLSGRYIPPCLTLGGSDRLAMLVNELVSHIAAVRGEVAQKLSLAKVNMQSLAQGQLRDVMFLQSLNRATARLKPMVACTKTLPPLAFYIELRSLLGELTALNPTTDAFACEEYDHDDLGATFADLERRIREQIRPPEKIYLELPLTKTNGIFSAELKGDHVTRPTAYYLGVESKEDPRAVISLVTDSSRFKLIAGSMAGPDAPVMVRGIDLQHQPVTPAGLPPRGGLHYFQVNRTGTLNEQRWAKMVKEGKLAAVWSDAATSDFKLAIYMPLPG